MQARPLNPFATVEQSIDAAVQAMLANALVSVDGGQAVGGIFDDAYALATVGAMGMATSAPSVLVAADVVPANAHGLPALVNGTAYVIVGSEPDGVGSTRLVLERSAKAAAP